MVDAGRDALVPVPAIRVDLIALFDRGELAKYLTDEEMAGLPEGDLTT